MINLENVNQTLKTVYLDVVSNQLNLCDPFLSTIKQTSSDVFGKQILFLLPYNSNDTNYLQLSTDLKTLSYTITISDKAIRACQNSAGAFVNLINSEMENLIKLGTFELSRQLVEGNKKELFNIIKQLDNKNEYIVDTLKNIYTGKEIQVLKTDKTALKSTILNINYHNNSITLDVDGLQVGDIAYSIDNKNQGIDGINEIFENTNVLYGSDKNKYEILKPNIIYKDKFSLDCIYKIIDNPNGDFNNLDFVICSNSTKRKIQEELLRNKDSLDIIKKPIGFNGLKLENLGVFSNKFVKDNEIYILNSDDWEFKQLCDWRWLEDTNGKILRPIQKSLLYEATLVKYCNLICKNPSRQYKIIFKEV